jgi:hypothetical protein
MRDAKEFAIDEKGKTHEVKTNIAGQKIRESYSAPRVIIAIMLFSGLANLAKNSIDNVLLIGVIWILLIVVIRTFVLHEVVAEEDLKRYKDKKS